MDRIPVRARLLELDETWGDERRSLFLGDWEIRLDGLDRTLAALLDRRWGGFVRPAGPAGLRVALRVFRTDPVPGGLPGPARGETYRLDGGLAGTEPVIRSYHFAATRVGPRGWQAALADNGVEPRERALENLVRYLVARAAVESGGFAMHAAGVLRDGRAHLFCGPSGAGKSTVVELSAGVVSLGDDFALLRPSASGDWEAPAVPFDNRETAPSDPPRGWFPVAGIWRLYQARRTRVERPPDGLACASLSACVAMAPAMPDLAERILAAVERYATGQRFAHLHFRRSPDFWNRIGSGSCGD